LNAFYDAKGLSATVRRASVKLAIFIGCCSGECNIFVEITPAAVQCCVLPSAKYLNMETRVLTLFDDEFFPQEPPKEKTKKEKTPRAAAPVTPQEPGSGPESVAEENEVRAEETVAEKTPSESLPENGETSPGNEAMPAIPAGLHKEWPAAASAPEISIGREPGMEDAGSVQEEASLPQQEPVPEETADIDVTLSREMAITGEAVDATETASDPGSATADIDEIMHDTDIAEMPEKEEQEEESTAPGAASAADNDGNADQELNQQILSELIQLDYTALMQKDYSFDVSAATVISRGATSGTATPDVSEDADPDNTAGEADEVFEEVAPLPEWKLDKKYYTIGEVAQLFEVNTSHIRFWTNEFKLKPRTTRKGDRLYSPKDIAELRLIHHLVKVKKHTIKGAREKLRSGKSGVNNKLDLKESLLQLKDTLLKIRDQL